MDVPNDESVISLPSYYSIWSESYEYLGKERSGVMILLRSQEELESLARLTRFDSG
jgi:hypothetical protein